MKRADYVIPFNDIPADDPEFMAQQIVDTIRDGCQVVVEVHFWPDDASAKPVPVTVVVPGESLEDFEDVKRERDEARAALAVWNADFPCDGGCSDEPIEGPQEDCSRHGRRPRDLWNRLDEARAAIERVEALHAQEPGVILRCKTCGLGYPCDTIRTLRPSPPVTRACPVHHSTSCDCAALRGES